MQGSVKWFNDQKGFGFVVEDESKKDIFVHYSEIQASGFKTLNDGDRVEFDIEQTNRGNKAVKVRKVA